MNNDFIKGFKERLKQANEISPSQHTPTIFNTNTGSIFPTLETQSKWKYARTKGKLQLHDGNTIHQFSFGEDEKGDQDFPMTKIEDASYFDFGKEMETSGTAQVHRANPGHIYVTLHDGKTNPTFNIKHVNEMTWRASPKLKKKAEEEPINSFRQGMKDKLAFLDSVMKGIHHTGNFLTDSVASIGKNPLASAGVGLGLGAAYDLGRRAFYNTEEENTQETGQQRLTRYLAPSLGLGLSGMAMNNLMPNRYKFDPVYNSSNLNNRPNTHSDVYDIK
mgnify:FL=1